MSFDYSSMGVTADELITEFGAPATLTRPADPAYNPATGKTVQASPLVQATTAVVIDYEQKYVDGTLIRAGDKQCFLTPKGIVPPRQGDVLAWQGVNYKVIGVTPIAPAGVNVLYELQLRSS